MCVWRIIFVAEWVVGVLLYLCVLYYSTSTTTILYSPGVGGISKAHLSFLRIHYSRFEGKWKGMVSGIGGGELGGNER